MRSKEKRNLTSGKKTMKMRQTCTTITRLVNLLYPN